MRVSVIADSIVKHQWGEGRDTSERERGAMKGGRTGKWWGENDGLRGGTVQGEGIKTEDKEWERGDNKRENEPAEEKRNGNAPGGGKKLSNQYSTGVRTQAHTFTLVYWIKCDRRESKAKPKPVQISYMCNTPGAMFNWNVFNPCMLWSVLSHVCVAVVGYSVCSVYLLLQDNLFKNNSRKVTSSSHDKRSWRS